MEEALELVREFVNDKYENILLLSESDGRLVAHKIEFFVPR